MNKRPYTFDRVVRILIAITVLVGLFWLVQRLSDVLLPFLIALLLAYMLQPLVHFFQVKLKFRSRVLSVVTTLLLLIAALTSVVMLLGPVVSTELQKLSQLISGYSRNLDVNSIVPVAWQNEIRDYMSKLDIQSALQNETLIGVVKKIAPQLWSLINGSLDLVMGLAVVMIVFLYLIFILMDYERISSGMYSIIPPKYKALVISIIEDLEQGMNRYFRGQALIALLVGVLSAIGFTIVKLPLAVVLGLIVGALTMVPYLKTLALIPAAIMGLMQSAETGQSLLSIFIGIAAVFIVVQAIEDLFLVPRIMGKVTGLNPAIILLSLSIWGSLLGIAGMIIALPVTTLLISYYKRFVLGEEEVDLDEPVVPEQENKNSEVEM